MSDFQRTPTIAIMADGSWVLHEGDSGRDSWEASMDLLIHFVNDHNRLVAEIIELRNQLEARPRLILPGDMR